VFDAAKRADQPLGDVPARSRERTAIRNGCRARLVVGVLYKVWLLPVWILFPAKVVWIVDESRRFGFAYGTLPIIRSAAKSDSWCMWNAADDSVW
jgi:uncharacterized protein (UPF0548 family)